MRAEKGLRGLLAILQPIAWLILRGFGEHPQYVAALFGDGKLQHARRALRAHAPGEPILLYVCGQSLNLALTLLMAWIMFYKVFPEITAKI
nr:hypothetical protein [Desulfovibrio piger]